MKIVVAVKQVAALDDEFELDDAGTGIDPESVDWELNEWDSFSLEAAVQMREAAGAGEVIAVSVGDGETGAVLQTCLAKGADRAIRVWTDGLESADAIGIARILTEVVRREQPDLVLCGVQSSDSPSAATGVALAGLAGLPHVAVVRRIDIAGTVLTVERELDGGVSERLRLSTPALLTVQTGINTPRYANFRAIKQAREKPMEELTLDGLGLDAETVARATGSRIRAFAAPEKTQSAEIIPGDAAAVAARITTIINEKLGVTL